MTDKTEFTTLIEHLKKLCFRYYRALTAFYAFEAMVEATDVSIVGKEEAEANAEIINRFKNFLLPAKESIRVYFFIELAKLFDVSKQSLHINKVVNFSDSNITHLNVEAFKGHNAAQPREFLESLVKEYKGVDRKDLEEIRADLEKHKDVIERLKIYRDEWLAHDDINRNEPPTITGKELKALFEVLAKILNIFTSKLNSEGWMWDHVERDTKHHVKLVIEYLRRFEPYRINEIELELDAEFKKYSKPHLPEE